MSFWNFTKGTDDADILQLDGEIVADPDWWSSSGQVVARRFRNHLSHCGDVTVYINSPGGDVFAAAEMYTALKEHKGHVTVKVTGIAASAASVVAMAGDEILMSPVAYMMIHDPWTIASGNAREFEKQAAILREVGEGLISAYCLRTGKTRDEIVAMLTAETYMSAQRCVDEGFADGILDYSDHAPGGGKPISSMMQASAYTGHAVMARLTSHIHIDADRQLTPQIAPTVNDELERRINIANRARIISALF